MGCSSIKASRKRARQDEWRVTAGPQAQLAQFFRRAAVLCIVQLRSIEEASSARETLCQRERIFGNYDDGRYAWFLEMAEKFDEPIAAKGNRLLWEWR